MFHLTREEELYQTASVLNTIAPTHLPPRLALTEEEEEEEKDDFFAHYQPVNESQKRLRTMQRAHRPTRLTANGLRMEASSNANRVPFHTNNPYVQLGFWSYLAYNLTDPCCGTSDWLYDNQDYDGDLDDVDVDDNGLFWRDYNPKRELDHLQWRLESRNLSERQRSYLQKKMEHLTRDPLQDYFEEEEEEDETLLTMDESLAAGHVSGMEVAFRKYKQFQREQRRLNKYYQQRGLQSTFSF